MLYLRFIQSVCVWVHTRTDKHTGTYMYTDTRNYAHTCTQILVITHIHVHRSTCTQIHDKQRHRAPTHRHLTPTLRYLVPTHNQRFRCIYYTETHDIDSTIHPCLLPYLFYIFSLHILSPRVWMEKKKRRPRQERVRIWHVWYVVLCLTLCWVYGYIYTGSADNCHLDPCISTCALFCRNC